MRWHEVICDVCSVLAAILYSFTTTDHFAVEPSKPSILEYKITLIANSWTNCHTLLSIEACSIDTWKINYNGANVQGFLLPAVGALVAGMHPGRVS